MTPETVLALADALLSLEPLPTYPRRGAERIAHAVGASSFKLELAEGRLEVSDAPMTARSLSFVLQGVGGPIGNMVLGFERVPSEDIARLSRFATSSFARGLDLARRLMPSILRRAPDVALRELRRAPLTPRERDVVGLLVAGSSTRAIASETGLTISTVNTYLKRIFAKLGVHSRVELVARLAGGPTEPRPLLRRPIAG
jgi:DNA-binding CsgD family transcriptional regulator